MNPTRSSLSPVKTTFSTSRRVKTYWETGLSNRVQSFLNSCTHCTGTKMESTVRVSLCYYPTKRNQPTYGCFNFSKVPATKETLHCVLPLFRSDNDQCCALHLARSSRGTLSFHLCQAWYRKIQAFNLTRDYRDVKSLVGRWLRLVFALPTLSADSVRECFLTTLTDLMPDTTEANLFADYILHVPTSRLLLPSDHVGRHPVPKRQNHKCL